MMLMRCPALSSRTEPVLVPTCHVNVIVPGEGF